MGMDETLVALLVTPMDDELTTALLDERDVLVTLAGKLLVIDRLLAELDVLLTADALAGIEHSLVPPDTFVPAPNVTSPHTKLPDNIL